MNTYSITATAYYNNEYVVEAESELVNFSVERVS